MSFREVICEEFLWLSLFFLICEDGWIANTTFIGKATQRVIFVKDKDITFLFPRSLNCTWFANLQSTVQYIKPALAITG